MDTILKWTNLNTEPVTTKIYRGDAPLDRSNLTGELVTLTNQETTWTDTTTLRGKKYYYVVETTNALDKVSTANIPVTATPRKGPGPQDLILGDYNYGYFGTMFSADLIGASELRAQVGLSATVAPVASAPLWFKYVRNGKVIYVPNTTIGNPVSWETLYNLGLVFGVEGPGPYNAGTNVPQNKKITINGDQFRVRLMTGFSDDYTKYPPTGVANEPAEWVNEWNDFVYPLSVHTPEGQRFVNVGNDTTATIIGSGVIGVYVQERSALTGGQGTLRGSSTNSKAGLSQRNNVGATQGYGWYPVLELIDT